MIQDLVINLLYIGYAVAVLLVFGTVLTWVERKQAAIMSDRIGANRAYVRIPFTQFKLIWWGLFHGLADGLKMMLKEDFKPNSYDRVAYAIAPWVVFTPVLLVFAVIPFGGTLHPGQLVPALSGWFGDKTYPLQIARLDAGLLVVFAFGGLTIIGAMLAGWSSDNKFSLLGGVARRLADDLLRTDHGPDGAGADPHLRHRRPGRYRATAIRRAAGLPARLGSLLPALRRDPVPDRGHRGEQAHPLRPARSRVRAHCRLLTPSTAR